ncbi:MFS transporter [Alkaliphilus hydrothermalis]|uniref:MFS family permease n=1 Tax=Alkaliphilus hydrothermalis TaxID=1482730 RepID=A0ABS2NQL3_9FIRM|nr:MFS transporter [Alkaliphilus hydrothermalis]MBM7615214.1 MFS family permease [Alkaliphilus hydrothermalis]
MLGIPKVQFDKVIWYFLFSIWLVHVAAYVVVPIYPILLKNEKGMGSAEIGVIIGALAFFMQLGSLIAGMISDRIGNKYSILISNFLQSIGLLGLGFSNSFIFLAVFSALNGMGTGIYIPSTKAAISHIASEDKLTTAFSLRNMASHMGISIAGLIILGSSSNMNFIYGGILYGLLFFFALFFLPNDCGEHDCPAIKLSSYVEILKNRHFMLFILISTLIWSLHTQLAFVLPLRGDAILNHSGLLGVIWSATSVMVILSQSTISRSFLEKSPQIKSIFIGILLLGTGVVLIGFASSFPFLVLCSMVFITGEMFTMPTLDSVTGVFADPKYIGAYFALANFATGIGSALGTFVSGRIIETYSITDSPIPWMIYGGYTIALALLFRLLIKKDTIQKANHHNK